MAVAKKSVKKLSNPHKRICKCGKGFKYAGRGRPFKSCPRCRKEK